MKKLLFLFFCICIYSPLHAQELSFDKKNNFTLNGNIIQNKQIKQVLKANPIALKKYKKGHFQYLVSGILLLSGGAFLGYEIGIITGGNSPNIAKIGISSGIVGLAFLAIRGSKRKYSKAVVLYNTSKNEKKVTIQPSKKGVGMVIQF